MQTWDTRLNIPRWRKTMRRWLRDQRFWRVQHDDLPGYGYALLGIAVASLVIALVGRIAHIGNISLLYLPVVLWLATRVGRGPAVLASLLSFLAYDFLFIPPLYRFTVADPTEWLSLFALLTVSLVASQLASAVRDRAHEAQVNQQRTATLYSFAELIASTTDQAALFNDLTRRLLAVFAPSGMTGVAILLPGLGIYPAVQALALGTEADAERNALRLTSQTYAAEAAWALERGEAVGDTLLRTLTRGGDGVSGVDDLVYFVPLRSSQRTVGLLAMTGKQSIRSLVLAKSGPASGAVSSQQDLFAACCDQVALAIDRYTLKQQAIHAEALHESNQLKDVFLGSVTHDLRTPLASIKAAVTSLLGADVTWSERDRREFLESIDESADRLNRLVGNLLDISRQEAGVATPRKEWYLLGDVLAAVLDQLELAGRTEGREIIVDIADDAPLVPMDHAQIEQVLTNLLENAFKYSPVEKPVRVTARVIEEIPRAVEVRVIDQGIGIPPRELHAIFDKFYRVEHVSLPWDVDRPPTGTGLGLAISDNIIRAHDGRIWAESEPGKGTTMIFRLPIPADVPAGALPEVATDQPPAIVAGEDEAHHGDA